MKRSFRVLAVMLSLLMLSAAVPLSSLAYGATDKTLVITHINVGPDKEGCGLIISGDKYPTAGTAGTFAWWRLVVFDWDSAEKVYKVTNVLTNSSNSDKSKTAIPKTGFAYGICKGNNYPSIGQPDKPNYVSKHVSDSCDFVANIKVGDKAYLYGTDLKNGIIVNNGKLWYAEDFVSESYIKIGEPDAGKTAYDPENTVAIGFDVKPNGINKVNYVSGASLIFTEAVGDVVPTTTAKYQWWYAAIFDYDDVNKCYKLVSIDRVTGNNYPKVPVIPKNGFALCDCAANSTALNNAAIDMKVYLYDIDLKNGTLGANPVIRFVDEIKGRTAYDPKITGTRLKAPAVKEAVLDYINSTVSGIKLTWDKVSGATGYVIALNNGSACADGDIVLAPTKLTDNSYTIAKNVMSVGETYTLSLYATGGSGYIASPLARYTVKCVSDSAYNTSLKDKKVVAFGDSLTERTGYVQMLYGYIGTDVINKGIGGNNTNHGKARFDVDILAQNADIVTVCFGMNDQACNVATKTPNIPLETYRANLDYFAKELTEKGVDVIFITPNPVNTHKGYYDNPGTYGLDYGYGFMDDFCDAMRQVAIKYNCGLVDVNYEFDFLDIDKMINVGDGIHQSAAGHQKYAEFISDYMLAKYDGTDKATMTVKCVDKDNNVIKTIEYVGKAGAHITLAAPEIDGDDPTEEDIETTFVDGKEFVFHYTDVQLLGDVDGNGKIEAKDYLLLKRCCLKTTSLTDAQLNRSDVDGSGKIDAKDYMLLKRHCLKTYEIKQK